MNLRLAFSEPVRASYQRAARPGLLANAVAAWRNKATWREFGYLTGLFFPFYALDVIVFTVWVRFGAAISLPLCSSSQRECTHRRAGPCSARQPTRSPTSRPS